MMIPMLGCPFPRGLLLVFAVLAIAFPICATTAGANRSEPATPPWERWSQAAADTTFPAWQREFMSSLARGEVPAAPGARRPRAGSSAAVEDAADGSVAASAPGARFVHTAVHDSQRGRMLVFGGLCESGNCDAGVWALNLDGAPKWTLLTTSNSGPGPRYLHSAIYDPVRDRIVVFGGYDEWDSESADVWALSLGGVPGWTLLTDYGYGNGPVPRGGHSAIYDPIRDRMVVFGGNGYGLLDDVWELPLSGSPWWTELSPSGPEPSPRLGHSAIYDQAGDRMVVFGGTGGSGALINDVWALSLSGTPTWAELSPAGASPAPRYLSSAIYDHAGGRMVVFGGGGDSGVFDDAWVLSLSGSPAWTTLIPAGGPPGGREGQSAIYDPVHGRMVMYGGGGSSGLFGDVWALNLTDPATWECMIGTWGPEPPGPSPSARHGHTAVHDPVRDRMVVFGGWDASGRRNDVWMAAPGTSTWTAATPVGTPPSPRYTHSAIYDFVRDRMIVFGGFDPNGYRNDVWTLSLADPPTWTALATVGTPPSPRQGHSAVYDPVRGRMIVFGGYYDAHLGDVWALTLTDPPTWTQLSPTGPPPAARQGHSAIYDPVGDRIVVFGGTVGTTYLDDVWTLTLSDPPAWAALAPVGTKPAARCDHRAVYDPGRDRMVVFGGYFYDGIDNHFNDTWALGLGGLPAWSPVPATGPAARRSHSALYDPTRAVLVVFGGSGVSGSFYNDVWTQDLGEVTDVDDPGGRPLVSHLRPPAPNPTRGMTSVGYALAQAGRVQLGVYDLSGRLVRRLVDGERPAGAGTVAWNGTDESGARREAGVYFVRMTAPGLHETRRVVLLR